LDFCVVDFKENDKGATNGGKRICREWAKQIVRENFAIREWALFTWINNIEIERDTN